MSKPPEEVARFPPLPRPPSPPSLPPDPRQDLAARVLGTLSGLVSQGGMRVGGANLSTGYHASAVDLGALQTALTRGLRRFSPEQLEARWDEIFRWIAQVLRQWAQRTKEMRIERAENGIHIKLQTQDDRGYYRYSFDVFPHEAHKKAT